MADIALEANRRHSAVRGVLALSVVYIKYKYCWVRWYFQFDYNIWNFTPRHQILTKIYRKCLYPVSFWTDLATLSVACFQRQNVEFIFTGFLQSSLALKRLFIFSRFVTNFPFFSGAAIGSLYKFTSWSFTISVISVSFLFNVIVYCSLKLLCIFSKPCREIFNPV